MEQLGVPSAFISTQSFSLCLCESVSSKPIGATEHFGWKTALKSQTQQPCQRLVKTPKMEMSKNSHATSCGGGSLVSVRRYQPVLDSSSQRAVDILQNIWAFCVSVCVCVSVPVFVFVSECVCLWVLCSLSLGSGVHAGSFISLGSRCFALNQFGQSI